LIVRGEYFSSITVWRVGPARCIARNATRAFVLLVLVLGLANIYLTQQRRMA